MILSCSCTLFLNFRLVFFSYFTIKILCAYTPSRQGPNGTLNATHCCTRLWSLIEVSSADNVGFLSPKTILYTNLMSGDIVALIGYMLSYNGHGSPKSPLKQNPFPQTQIRHNPPSQQAKMDRKQSIKHSPQHALGLWHPHPTMSVPRATHGTISLPPMAAVSSPQKYTSPVDVRLLP